MNHLKQWWGLHATIIMAVAAVVAQTSDHFFTTHPKATFGELCGAIGWAVVMFFVKPPTGGINGK